MFKMAQVIKINMKTLKIQKNQKKEKMILAKIIMKTNKMKK